MIFLPWPSKFLLEMATKVRFDHGHVPGQINGLGPSMTMLFEFSNDDDCDSKLVMRTL